MSTTDPVQPPSHAAPRAGYEPPAVDWEESLEDATLAAACGKVFVTDGAACITSQAS